MNLSSYLFHSLILYFVETTLKSIEDTKKKPLGEQAMLLTNSHDRLVAMKRTVATMQVLVARSMVVKALSLLSVR